jgi:hypothetical protein
MEENRMVKRVFEGHSGRRRKTVRPRKRWLDDIEEDFRLMKVKRWRKKATKREVWAKIVREAKVLPWAVAPRSKYRGRQRTTTTSFVDHYK